MGWTSMKPMKKYSWEKTGHGATDNLGVQLQKVIRGTGQGSIYTRRRYTAASRRFVKFLGKEFKLKKLSNFQNKHVKAYVEKLQAKGCSSRYIKTELSGIRYLHYQIPQTRFELMEAEKFNKMVQLNPTPDGRTDRAWTEREVQEMQERAIKLGQPKIAQAIEATRATGMRLDEMASLRRHQVENALKSGELHLTNTKGGRPRDIPLSTRAKEILFRSIQGVPRGRYVFCPEDEKVHVFKEKIQSFIGAHREEIQDADREQTGHNLSPEDRGALTFHGLRHSFAREYYYQKLEEYKEEYGTKEAIDLAERKTSKVLGHNRGEITRTYTMGGKK